MNKYIGKVKLTKKQVYALAPTKKHWSEKKEFYIKLIKNFGYTILPEQLEYFLEVIVPNEKARFDKEEKEKQKQFFIDSQSGKIKSHLTPTDIKGDFSIVTEPVIGNKYHISWAFSAAVFVLKEIKNGICYLDNPKYKRKTLLTCKLSELRNLRSSKPIKF